MTDTHHVVADDDGIGVHVTPWYDFTRTPMPIVEYRVDRIAERLIARATADAASTEEIALAVGALLELRAAGVIRLTGSVPSPLRLAAASPELAE